MRALALLLALAACTSGDPLTRFAATTPALDPIVFFTGHVRSWGVVEDRGGTPTGIVTTDCVGTPDSSDALRMVQTLDTGDGQPTTRTWMMRRTSPGHYVATANDMVGTADGETTGRALHWTWTLATKPGSSLFDVTMDQWFYALEDGAVLIRTSVRKLGIKLAGVSERFAHVP